MNKKVDIGLVVGNYLVIKKTKTNEITATFNEIDKYIKELKKEVKEKSNIILEINFDRESLLYYKKYYFTYENGVEINKNVEYADFRLRFVGALGEEILVSAYKAVERTIRKNSELALAQTKHKWI